MVSGSRSFCWTLRRYASSGSPAAWHRMLMTLVPYWLVPALYSRLIENMAAQISGVGCAHWMTGQSWRGWKAASLPSSERPQGCWKKAVCLNMKTCATACMSAAVWQLLLDLPFLRGSVFGKL